MTRDDIKDEVIIRLGQRQDLSSAIETSIRFAQMWLENRPFLPWFLQTAGSDFNLQPGVTRYALPANFIREVDVAGIKGSLLIGEMVDGVLVPGTFEEIRKYETGVLDVRYVNAPNAKPLGYAIAGEYLLLGPAPDQPYLGRWRSYYAHAPVLANAGSRNAWTEQSPDSLIAATGLRMASGFLKSDKVYQEFRAFHDEVEAALMKSDVARQEAGIVRLLGETC